jgi:hypothetical protein
MADKSTTHKFNKITSELEPSVYAESIDNEIYIVNKIQDRLNKMIEFRKKNCYWQSSYTDWVDRWDRDELLWSMQTGKQIKFTTMPVSSSVVFGPVQAALAQFADSRRTFIFKENPGVEKLKAKITQTYIENFQERTHFENIEFELFRDQLIYGTAFTYNGWLTKKRKVEKMLSRKEIEAKNPINIVVEEGQDIEEVISRETQKILSNKKNLTETIEITDYDDLYVRRVDPRDVYFEPHALCINGMNRESRDCVEVITTTIQEVVNTYSTSDDPFILKKNINTDQIKTGFGKDNIDLNSNNFNRNELTNDPTGDLVKLYHYWNKYEDKYIIICNDTLIRNGPLPYNHKLLPYSRFVGLPLPNSLYGAGIPALLDDIQSQDERFKALTYGVAEYNADPITSYYGSGSFETQLKEVYESGKPKTGTLIKQDTAQDTIVRAEPITMPYDIFRLQDGLKEEAIKVSGVNSLLNGNPNLNTAVRNNQLIQENSLLILRMIANNYATLGLTDLVKQLVLVGQQKEDEHYQNVESQVKKDTQSPEMAMALKKLRTSGFEVNSNGEMQKSNEGGIVELTPDMIKAMNEVDITVKVDTVALSSKQLLAQESAEVLDKILLVFSNPMLTENKVVMAALKDYLDKKNVDPNILGYFQDDSSDESDILADYQNEQMMAGNDEAPLPDMSETHLAKHSVLLNEKLVEFYQLENEIKGFSGLNIDNTDMMTQEQMISDYTALNQQKEELLSFIDRLRTHLIGDIQKKTQRAESAITAADSILSMGMPMQDPMMMAQGGQMADPMAQDPAQQLNPMAQI